jgi:hypothetical protein
MPSHADLRFCAYGDSHLGSLKLALSGDLVDPGAVDVEFWGADGPLFRDIHEVDGVMRPTTREARARVLMINGAGRDWVGPDDFDVFLFFGARLRTHDLFHVILGFMAEETGFLSRGALERVIDRWLMACRSYRTARKFAESGVSRVMFAPASFLSDGLEATHRKMQEIESGLSEERAAWIWSGIESAMARDGVELIEQPARTRAGPCMTRAEFACDNAVALKDPVHKNAAYGAIIWNRVFARLEREAERLGAAAE